MATSRILIFAATAAALVTLGPTLAHAAPDFITLAPRTSLAALLHLPAPAAPPAPELVAEGAAKLHEAPCEQPDQAPPAALWASAMRAFGRR